VVLDGTKTRETSLYIIALNVDTGFAIDYFKTQEKATKQELRALRRVFLATGFWAKDKDITQNSWSRYLIGSHWNNIAPQTWERL